MLRKSSTYYPRQMSSSLLIFSIGAISMKVNPAFVFILIIASLLAIHLSTYIQPSYRFWGWAPFMALTPSLRCLRPLLWGGLILGSYHGPHTFSWGVFACCHETVWTWTHIMVLTPSPEVSLPLSCGGLYLGSFHGPHTFCLRCLRLSSWDGLILDSCHGPHTFSWGVSACRHETVLFGLMSWSSHLPSEVSPPVVMRRSDLGLMSWSSHLPSEVSPPVVMRRSVLGLLSWPTHLLFEVSLLVVMQRFLLGLVSWPTHLLPEVSPLIVMWRFVLGLVSWPIHLLPEVSPSVMKRSHPPSSGMSLVAPRFSTTMWTWERSLPLIT